MHTLTGKESSYDPLVVVSPLPRLLVAAIDPSPLLLVQRRVMTINNIFWEVHLGFGSVLSVN